MYRVSRLVEKINDEICGAIDYAEMYVEYKTLGNQTWANRMKEAATDELKHTTYVHDLALYEIDELRKNFVPPQEMEDEWTKSHKNYVEKVAWIKQMLSM